MTVVVELVVSVSNAQEFDIKVIVLLDSQYLLTISWCILIRNVLTRRREYGTYLATARRHRRRIKMQKRDE